MSASKTKEPALNLSAQLCVFQLRFRRGHQDRTKGKHYDPAEPLKEGARQCDVGCDSFTIRKNTNKLYACSYQLATFIHSDNRNPLIRALEAADANEEEKVDVVVGGLHRWNSPEVIIDELLSNLQSTLVVDMRCQS